MLADGPQFLSDPDRLSSPLRAEADAYAQARTAGGVSDTGFDVEGARRALAKADRAVTIRLPVREETFGGVPGRRLGDGPTNLIHFHGGGFVGGTYFSHGQIAAALAEALGRAALFPEYRLAPENPFPAAFEDAEAVLDALPDGPLLLSGDSVGAALALHLARRARGSRRIAALALLAPMLDFDPATSAYMRAYPRAHAMISNAIGAGDLSDPKLAGIDGPLDGLPPVLIQTGGADYVQDDGHRLAAGIARAGGAVVLEHWPAMPHVWHRYVPDAPEATRAIARAGRFLLDHVPPRS